MIVVEDLLDVRKRLGVLRLLRPRKVDEPVRIVAQHGVLGRRGRHLVHAGELRHRLLLHLFGQVLCEQFFAQAGVLLDVVSELRVNGLELFAEIVFLLRLVDVLPDVLGDLALEAGDLQLVVEAAFKELEPLNKAGLLQKLLLDLLADAHIVGAHVDVLVDVADGREPPVHFLRDLAVRLHDVFDELLRGAEVGLLQRGIAVDGGELIRDGVDIAALDAEIARTGAVERAGKHADAVAGQARHLTDARHRADGIEIALAGHLLLRVLLFGQKDEFIVEVGTLDRGKRDPPPRVERDGEIGKDDLRPHGDDGKDERSYFVFCHSFLP